MRYCSALVLAALLSVSSPKSGFAASVKFTPTHGIEFVETRIDDRFLSATVLNSGDAFLKSVEIVCDFFNHNSPISTERTYVEQLRAGGRVIAQIFKPKKQTFDTAECRIIDIQK